MAVAVKGLLKGLRFISHMFEEDEQEMQISAPTDVRHVAHIGWDGPSVSAPSWMDKFKGDGEPVSPTPAQGSSESVDESPSRRHRKASKNVEPAKQSRKKKSKGSSKSSAKTKSGTNRVEESGPDPDLAGG